MVGGPVLPSRLGLALPCGVWARDPLQRESSCLAFSQRPRASPPCPLCPACPPPAPAPRGARTAELSSPAGSGLGVRPELWPSGPCHVLVSPVAGTPVSVTSPQLPLGWGRRKPRAAPVPDPASEKHRCARVRLRPPLGRLHCQVAHRRGSVLGEPGPAELGSLPPPAPRGTSERDRDLGGVGLGRTPRGEVPDTGHLLHKHVSDQSRQLARGHSVPTALPKDRTE